MIGDPDVVICEQGACSGSRTLKIYREHIKSSSPAGLQADMDVKSELLREDPEMADWDFELKSKLLIVEGNIGVGKTTLTKKLADKLGYRIFLEPTTENPYLGKEFV